MHSSLDPSKLALFTRTKPQSFDPDSEQSFFEATMKPYLTSFLASENAVTHLSTFNLGDTASGKSFTFRAPNTGLLYKTLNTVQDLAETVTVHEIIGKDVNLLFLLSGREDYAKDIEETLNNIIGKRGGNQMNSASCSIYSLVVTIKLKNDDKVITMFDLRGPERMSKCGDIKARKECLAINQNLSSLYKVINSIALEKKCQSFRDTKLTMILKDVLTNPKHQGLVFVHKYEKEAKDGLTKKIEEVSDQIRMIVK